jgi:hypothetical protein
MHYELHDAVVVLVRVIAAVTVLLVLLNGAVMLASPPRWFMLPGWLRGNQGLFTEREYSSGWGAIRLRFIGAVFVGAVSWMLYHSFLGHS